MTRWRWVLIAWTVLLFLVFAVDSGPTRTITVLPLLLLWLAGVVVMGAVRQVTRR